MDRSPPCAPWSLTRLRCVRAFNVKSAMASISDVFNIPAIMHPDVYNTVEKQAADTYKFHGKVCDGTGARAKKSSRKGYNAVEQ